MDPVRTGTLLDWWNHWFTQAHYFPSLWIHLSTHLTAFCIALNFYPYPWPQEILFDCQICFSCFEILSYCTIWLLMKDLVAQRSWNVHQMKLIVAQWPVYIPFCRTVIVKDTMHGVIRDRKTNPSYWNWKCLKSDERVEVQNHGSQPRSE